ncbi:MAG: DUF3021 family protein [Clostridiaceae bacterium]|nr:DUF3021 family protein [Clostridiaceae bacterium]
MKISEYLKWFVRDFLVACGLFMVIISIFLSINSTGQIGTSLFWQIILIALAFTFYKFALVNSYEIGKKTQMVSFSVCFVLASLMIILWLWFFSPIFDIDKLIAYTLVIVIVKGLVYAMMYSDGHKQAKQLNEKLSRYKNVEDE